MEIEALNKAGAVEGQRVKVVVHAFAYTRGSAIIYGIPALLLVLGAVLGKEIMPRFLPSFDTDTLSAVFGFSFLLISFILVKFWADRQSKKSGSQPVIEEILP
jgi:sigma-E factor negative regulatory protein RseC